jgi:hypothetical protein
VWGAFAAAALIKQDDSIAPRIEKTPHLAIGATAWATMQEHHGLTGAIAALFEIQFMQCRDA